MTRHDPKINFIGMVPTTSLRKLAEDTVEKIRSQAPQGSSVKLIVVSVGRQFDGVVQVKTPVGCFDVHRSGRNPESIIPDLEGRSQYFLSQWDSLAE